jgi:hypothetical protein
VGGCQASLQVLAPEMAKSGYRYFSELHLSRRGNFVFRCSDENYVLPPLGSKRGRGCGKIRKKNGEKGTKRKEGEEIVESVEIEEKLRELYSGSIIIFISRCFSPKNGFKR